MDAVTEGGMLAVFSGSQIPSKGFKARCAIPVLVLWDVRSKIAVPVVSDPVPAVVGTAIKGLRGFVMGFPAPRGALTKSRKEA